MKQLLYISILFFFAACATQKTCSEKFPPATVIHDSIVTETVVNYHDTVIHIPGATVTERWYIRDTVTRIDTVIRNSQASLAVMFHNGVLTATCKADSLQQLVTGLKSVIIKLNAQHSREKIVNVPVEIIKTRVPKWMLAVLAVFILQNVFKIIRLFNPVAGSGIIDAAKKLLKL